MAERWCGRRNPDPCPLRYRCVGAARIQWCDDPGIGRLGRVPVSTRLTGRPRLVQCGGRRTCRKQSLARLKQFEYLKTLLGFAFRENPLLYVCIAVSVLSVAAEIAAMAGLLPLIS